MLDEYKVKYLSDISKSLEEINETLKTTCPQNLESYWLKMKNQYPKCRYCHYEWKEQVVGPVGEGHSDLVEAQYCPNCGHRMTKIVEYPGV